jgi:hypothetical protein
LGLLLRGLPPLPGCVRYAGAFRDDDDDDDDDEDDEDEDEDEDDAIFFSATAIVCKKLG